METLHIHIPKDWQQHMTWQEEAAYVHKEVLSYLEVNGESAGHVPDGSKDPLGFAAWLSSQSGFVADYS